MGKILLSFGVKSEPTKTWKTQIVLERSLIKPTHLFPQKMTQCTCLWVTPLARRLRSGSAVLSRKRCWIWASPSVPSCLVPPPSRLVSWWISLDHVPFDWLEGNIVTFENVFVCVAHKWSLYVWFNHKKIFLGTCGDEEGKLDIQLIHLLVIMF